MLYYSAAMKLLHEAAKYAAIARIRYTNTNFGLGCVGVRKDGVIVHATNGGIRAPMAGQDPGSHAEARLCRKLTHDSTVYVARVVYDRYHSLVWAMSKPCFDCERSMRRKGVKRVYYTIAAGEYGTIIL